jgi:hypothetical protein
MFSWGIGKLCLAVIGTGGSVGVVGIAYLLENHDIVILV